MGLKSKRNRETAKIYDREKVYSIKEAVEILQRAPKVKFDPSLRFYC